MRLIDADLLKGKFIHGRFDDVYISEKEIQDAPTINAVEVVRCKDCKHGEKGRIFGSECVWCGADHLNAKPTQWFCADGERREE